MKSSRKAYRVEDFPPAYQAQIRAQIPNCGGSALPVVSCGKPLLPPQRRIAKTPTITVNTTAKPRRQPNETELRFIGNHPHGKPYFYEAVTLHLPGGSRYTPDWMWNGPTGRIHFVEVKGSYRLHSHGRARTAFLECAAHFPFFVFLWASWTGREWKIERYNDHAPTSGELVTTTKEAVNG